MRFLFVCGGTAGHINPALGIAGKLREYLPDCEILFIGSGRRMEKKLIPEAGYELKNIKVTGFTRSLSPGGIKANFAMLNNLRTAAKQSEAIIRAFKPSAVIGTGGYVCYPVLKKASELGIPTVMHESNAVPGLTTKMLSGRVDRVLTAFAGTETNYKKPERVLYTGMPVRTGFGKISRQDARAKLALGNEPLVVSFFGSLGAAMMNEMTADIIAKNNTERKFAHIHATGGGEEGVKNMQLRLENRGVKNIWDAIKIRPYIDNMKDVMAAADIVICRAGGSTIAELAHMGKPAILIPSPNVTNNHQEANARASESAGAARMILEKDCTGEKLYNEACKLIENKSYYEDMSIKSKAFGKPDSGEVIADIILGLIN